MKSINKHTCIISMNQLMAIFAILILNQSNTKLNYFQAMAFLIDIIHILIQSIKRQELQRIKKFYLIRILLLTLRNWMMRIMHSLINYNDFLTDKIIIPILLILYFINIKISLFIITNRTILFFTLNYILKFLHFQHI